MLKLCRRSFHASLVSQRKYYDVVVPVAEAAKPISFPKSVQISIHRIPPSEFTPHCPHGRFSYSELVEHKEGLRKIRESSVYYRQIAQETALVEIRGPLGVGYVAVPEWLDFACSAADGESPKDFWHGMGAKGGNLEEYLTPNKHSTVNLMSPNGKAAADEGSLHISCVDPESELQKRHWGFYRRRIARYITSVSDGFSLSLRMVGVGFRGQLEQVQLKGPERVDSAMYQRWAERWAHNISKVPMRAFIARQFPDSVWAQMLRMRQLLNHDINRHFTVVEPRDESIPMPEYPQKLVLKLGYSHDVPVIIPPFVKVSLPDPARIILTGPHHTQIQELASSIRDWRKPEPYKGKGIFVGEETIALRQKRVK